MEKKLKLGMIGLGSRTSYLVSVESAEFKGSFEVCAIADPDDKKVRQIIEKNSEFYADNARIYSNADEMLEKEELDGVMIGTRCSLHTEMAIKVIEKGIPLFLEKPVSTSLEQLKALNGARKKYSPNVIVSFPLKASKIVSMVKDIIDSGKIGRVESVQAFNDVPYGRVYQHSWYRDASETGGMWLQKATHDLDYIDYILDGSPVEICAMDSQNLFAGDKPEDLKCSECPDRDTCPEGPKAFNEEYRIEPHKNYMCCFSKINGSHDAGSAIIRYDNGIFVSYNQNFIVRNRSQRRGANFYGYKGTLTFDFYTGEIIFYSHGHDYVETINVAPDTKSSHFGGDVRLMRRFHAMMRGETENSMLGEGIKSALTCCLAEQSCREAKFIKIPHIDEF